MKEKNSKDKILCVLKRVNDRKELSPSGKKIIVMINDIMKCGLNFYESKDLLNKLKEEGFIYSFNHIQDIGEGYFEIGISENFDELYRNYNSTSQIEQGKNIKKKIVWALLQKQYQQSGNYFEDPFSEESLLWVSKTQQLIARVTDDAASMFSEETSNYERLKSLPYAKTGHLKLSKQKILKELLGAKDYLDFSDESLEEMSKEKIYEGGDAYVFIRDLEEMIQKTKNSMLLIDPFIDDNVFDFFLGSLSKEKHIKVKILKSIKSNLNNKLIQAFSKTYKNIEIEIKDSSKIHDRIIFIEKRCWVMGQSTKNAAEIKPTYMIEIEGVNEMYNIYTKIWKEEESKLFFKSKK